MCSATAVIASVESDKPFRILVANFNNQTVDILPRQVVVSDLAHTKNVVESHISHAEMLEVSIDDRATKFSKRHDDVSDIDNINEHLTDVQEQHMRKDEKPLTAVDIPI